MTATAAAVIEAWFPSNASTREWAVLSGSAPQLVATMRRYLLQLTTFLAPKSVDIADGTLRQLARWLTTETDVTVINQLTRTHVEDYKVWLAAQPGQKGHLLAKNTQRHRLRMIRIFLERLIEWDWPDAPGRNPILHGDIPPRSEPIPKFLTDQQAAAFMAAARNHPVERYRLVAQVLARTGLRASELCELAADAVTRIGTDGYWLRVPVGKLRNDRMIPLHPEVVDLFAEWTATNAEHIRRSRRLLADHHDPIDRRTVHRIVARVGAIAGIDDMHPHRLRHTLATQAINRGMRLEAIAALLGHRSLEMTLVYAKITDRGRRRRVRLGVRTDRRPLQHRGHARRPSRRDRNGRHGPATSGEPRTHARQRHVHPPRRARLPHGNHLRDLRLLRHRARVRPRPPPPTRPRSHPPADRPGQALRHPHHPSRGHLTLTTILRITPDRWRVSSL
jgi:site-specific recombinase XerD